MMNLVTCPLHQTASFAAEANFHRGAILSKWTPLSSFFLVNPQPLVEGSSLYISPYRLLAMDVWNVLPNAYASVFRSPLQHFMPPTKWNFLFSRKARELPSTYHPCGLLEVGASRVILSHDRKLTELTLLFREFVFSC